MANNDSIIAKYIAEKYIDSITGQSLPEEVLVTDLSREISVGVLGTYDESENNRYKHISSIDFTTRIKRKDKVRLNVRLSGLIFYPIMPTYEDITNYFLNLYNSIDSDNYENIDQIYDKHPEDIKRFPHKYKKVELEKVIGDGFDITINKDDGNTTIDLTDQLNRKLSLIENEILEKAIILDAPDLITIADLRSEEIYHKKVNKKNVKIDMQWNFELGVKVKTVSDGWLVTTIINNRSEKNPYLDNKLYNPHICIQGDNDVEFIGTELKCFEKTIKKKEPVYGIGRNCATEFIQEDNIVKSVSIPLYYQHRLKTNDKYNEYTKFDNLISEPIKNLKEILSEMKKDFEKCNKEFLDINTSLNEVQKNKFEEALDKYKKEIMVFEVGISKIETDDKVYKAFMYMNETFNTQLKSDRNKIPGWRLFQLVFIVSMIPYAIRSENKDDEDIKYTDIEMTNLLFFPTGGGKTEAFLGISTFTMFFDRLRGKNYGVTTHLKYPLRLLAVQQLERSIKNVVKANIVKKSHNELCDCKDFEVGFYVGGNVTPNHLLDEDELKKYSSNDNNELISNSDLNDKYRFIDTCPLCGEKKVNVQFNKNKMTLRHVCSNPECSMNELPLYISDEEIYRFLPTVLVGTIDKMALIGTSKEFKMLMGQVKYKCLKHGFTIAKDGNCPCCKEKLNPLPLLKDPAPTLFVQDELHLVRESLGTFDSHYESFIKYYIRKLLPEEQRKNICYIGATATISQYEDHINNLYGTASRRFPCEYPSINNKKDFYSYVDENDITRILMGYGAFQKHPAVLIGESTSKLRMLVYKMLLNYKNEYIIVNDRGLTCDEEEFKDLLYNYWINIVYNNKKNDTTSLASILGNQENNRLEEMNIALHNIKEMTSDNGFQEVRKTLFEINENKYKLNETNTILATSTISHGVDEDAFNIITFYGMPNNNAEYIQAYSRTGRKYTGIVIDIVTPTKLRDGSYLKNFVEFHDNKDDLVESVPINKWARNAVYSTLPGIFAGCVMQYYGNLYSQDYYYVNDVQKLFKSNVYKDEIITLIKDIYGCINADSLSFGYSNIIENEISNIYDGIKNDVFDKKCSLSDAISKYSKNSKKPMTSLRDTEDQVLIRAGE